MKILLTGANGQVGWEVSRQGQHYRHDVIACSRQQLDITDSGSVAEIISSEKPDIVVNAAAYTAVDKAEEDSDAAFLINRDASLYLAKACRDNNIPLIHISTDYVFDGTSDHPYSESDPVSPIGVYGVSKYEGEEAVRNNLARHVILRTSWVFGYHGNNFVKTMLRVGGERDELKVVSDQQGAPTSAHSIAACILAICSRIEDDEEVEWGTYHFSGTPYTSWHGFATEIIKQAHELGLIESKPRISPITTDQYPTPAQRPPNSRMLCASIQEKMGIWPVAWADDLNEMLVKLKADEDTSNTLIKQSNS